MGERHPGKSAGKRGRVAVGTVHGESMLVRYGQRASLAFQWFTGTFEVTFGSWLLIEAVLMLIFGNGIAELPGIVGVLIVCALPLPVYSALVRNIVIPSGAVIKAPERTRAPRSQVVGAACLLALVLASGLTFLHSAVVAISAVIALPMLLAWASCDRPRMFFLMLLIPVVAGIVSTPSAYMALGTVRCLGVGALAVGAGFLIAGIVATYRLLPKVSEPSDLDPESVYTIAGTWYTHSQISDALTSDSPYRRFLTAAFLCEYASPDVLVDLIHAADDPVPPVRVMVRRAISHIWGPDPEEVMRWHLERIPGKRSRRMLDTETLLELARKRAVVEARSQQHEHDVEHALVKDVAEDPPALDALIDLASNGSEGDVEVQYVAAELLGSTHSHRAYAALIHLMQLGDRDLASAAAEGFKGASPDAVVHIGPLFEDRREWVRLAAINAGLGLLDSLDITDASGASLARRMMRSDVIALSHHPKPVTRAGSLELLAHYGEEVADDLELACHDRFALVRGEALRSLAMASPDRAHPQVMSALEDPRAYVRATAVNCVAYLKMTEALPTVERLQNDPDDKVASLAKHLVLLSRIW